MAAPTATIALSRDTLQAVSKDVSVPTFNIDELSAGILHFGIGNFHRSHQARYLHRLMEKGDAKDWAIVGAGVLPVEIPGYEKLKAQDCLFTLIEQSTTDASAAVVGSIIDFIKPTDSQAVLDRLADPAIRIVTLTITKGGYFLGPKTGIFDASHPAVVAEAAAFGDALPKTVWGLIVTALKARRDSGVPPFTVLSCDNIPENGDATKRAVYGLATMVDPALAAWIDQNVAFPNCMVDRITPVTGDLQRERVRKLTGIDDKMPVVSETHAQWVVEDNFPTGRPALEKVGVEFVDDVAPFERMKMRILNGGHATLAFPAGLLGLEFVHDALADADVRAFLRKVEQDEIVPIVGYVPGKDLNDYLDIIMDRLTNPALCDQVKRLCFDGSQRQPKYVVASAIENLNTGHVPEGLALVSAMWCRYYSGETETGEKVTPKDAFWDQLHAAALEAKENPMAWVSNKKMYGELAESKPFTDAFCKWVKMLYSDGTRAALRAYVSQ